MCLKPCFHRLSLFFVVQVNETINPKAPSDGQKAWPPFCIQPEIGVWSMVDETLCSCRFCAFMNDSQKSSLHKNDLQRTSMELEKLTLPQLPMSSAGIYASLMLRFMPSALASALRSRSFIVCCLRLTLKVLRVKLYIHANSDADGPSVKSDQLGLYVVYVDN